MCSAPVVFRGTPPPSVQPSGDGWRHPPVIELPLGNDYELPPYLWGDNAGIAISGDTGSGKSNLMEVLIQLVIDSGYGVTVFDPHGDLARAALEHCLDAGESVRRRVNYICPSDPRYAVPLNPLAVDGDQASDLERAARRRVKVAHVARIMLHAWGETDFDSKPVLYKWTHRLLNTVASLGMTLADVGLFLDIESPMYETLVEAVPDLMARHEMAELPEMRPTDREAVIGSTRNRVMGFLSNPVVEATLGRAADAFSTRRAIREQQINLVNLEPGGVLSEEDQQIFANLYLNEALHAVFNTKPEERVPHFLFIDELPVFASCAPQLTAAMRQVRKMLLRCVTAFQGTNFFPERTEDQLLHAILGQSGAHFVLRHIDPVDAKFCGEFLALPGLDALKVKHELRQPVQYQDGFTVETLVDVADNFAQAIQMGGTRTEGSTLSDTWNEDATVTDSRVETDQASQSKSKQASQTNSSSHTDGTADASGFANGTSDSTQMDRGALVRAYTNARNQVHNSQHTVNSADVVGSSSTNMEGTTDQLSRSIANGSQSGRREGWGGSTARQLTSAFNWGFRQQSGGSRTVKQTLVPVMKWMEITSSVQFYSLDEQNALWSRDIACLAQGHAFMYVPTRGVVLVHIPLADGPYRDASPQFRVRKRDAFISRLLERPGYITPEQLIRERQEMLNNLLRELSSIGQTNNRSLGPPTGGGLMVPGQAPLAAEFPDLDGLDLDDTDQILDI